MKENGINVQNEKSFTQVVKLGAEMVLTLRPKGSLGGADVSYIPEKYRDSMALRRMLRTGAISEITEGVAKKKETEAVSERERKDTERHKAAMEVLDTSGENDMVQVQCAAIKADGKRCTRKTIVKVGSLKTNPAFCGTHKDTDPSLFELVDGDWTLRKEG